MSQPEANTLVNRDLDLREVLVMAVVAVTTKLVHWKYVPVGIQYNLTWLFFFISSYYVVLSLLEVDFMTSDTVEFLLLVLVTVVLWIIRWKYAPAGVFKDLALVLLFLAWHLRYHAGEIAGLVIELYFLRGIKSFSFWISTVGPDIIAVTTINQLEDARRYLEKAPNPPPSDRSEARLKPMLFPSRVFHKRKFPKVHSFSYSYLMVGIPVGWRGSIGTLLSTDLKSLPWQGRKPSTGWFSVESADYLARGDSVHGLQGKLEDYLYSINEDPEEFDDAYLITAPAFLGYSFNPASFWYLYRQQKLRAMIVEVSNTFDEKRMYFVRDEEDPKGKPAILSANWDKDFHVSPFNSRKGSYGLKALDPFHHPSPGEKFDNSIQLYSSKHAQKIFARVFSTSSGINPTTMTPWHTFTFILSWCWVGFVTFPRIIREAAKLFFLRRLSVFYRPEVLKSSIPRHATQDETAIAALFAPFLHHRVATSTLPLPLLYTPATTPATPTLYTPTSLPPLSPTLAPPMTFQPTTPQFYTSLARTPTLTSTLSLTPALHTTTHPTHLSRLLLPTARPSPNADFFHALRPLTRIRWMPLKALRNMSMKTFVLYDHQAHLSDLDWFAIAYEQRADPAEREMGRRYRQALLRVLVREWVGAGADVVGWVGRAGVAWWHVRALVGGGGVGEVGFWGVFVWGGLVGGGLLF